MVGSGIRSPAKLTNKQVLRRAAPIDIATAAAAAAAAATAVAAGAASATTAVAAAGGGAAALTSATREAAGDRIIIGGPASCEAPSALVPGIRTRGGAITEVLCLIITWPVRFACACNAQTVYTGIYTTACTL